MNKKVFFLFFTISLIGFLFGCNTCNANEIQQSYGTEINSQDFTSHVFVESHYLDSFNDRGILLESSIEQDISDNSSLQLPSLLNLIAFYNRYSNLTKRCKLETNGLIARNIPPVQHVSRNILFHSLQFHF